MTEAVARVFKVGGFIRSYLMRFWVFGAVLVLALPACRQRDTNPPCAQSADSTNQQFADTEAALYAGAAQVVVAGRFTDAKFPLKLRPGSVDTFYVGYPDSADPPRMFLDCLQEGRCVLLPYSLRRSECSNDNWRIGLFRVVSADTVEMWYEQDVPPGERSLLGPIRAQIRLAKDEAMWHVIRWKWQWRY